MRGNVAKILNNFNNHFFHQPFQPDQYHVSYDLLPVCHVTDVPAPKLLLIHEKATPPHCPII